MPARKAVASALAPCWCYHQVAPTAVAARSPTQKRSSSSSSDAARDAGAERRRHLASPLPTARRWVHGGASAVGNMGPKRHFHATASAAAVDPYNALGLKKDASQAEIKKAYYSLAKKFHPDVNKEENAKTRYQEVQDAYDTLSDEKKRAAYDRFGSASQQPGFDPNAFQGGGFPGGFADMFGAGRGGGGNAQDIFDSLFGAFGGRAGGARPSQSQQVFVGEDIDASIGISFLEMAKGTQKTVPISPVVDCPTCEGNGMKAGAEPQTCKSCNGTGTMTFVVQSGFTMASTCQACGGSGSRVDDKDLCGGCQGVGKVRERKTVEVKVPPGVEDGMKIKLAGQGDAPIGGGKGGRPGDLYVRVSVAPSRQFRRQGLNIYTDVTVPFHLALVGGTVRVPTLDKQVDVKVPTGTQPGEELVLKGRGVKHLYRAALGDLIVRFNLSIPRSLSADQRAAIEAYVEATETRAAAGTSTASSRPTPSASSGKAPVQQDFSDPAEADAEPAEEEDGEDRTFRQKKRAASG